MWLVSTGAVLYVGLELAGKCTSALSTVSGVQARQAGERINYSLQPLNASRAFLLHARR